MRKNSQNRVLYSCLILMLVGASILIAVASTSAKRTKPQAEVTESKTEEKLPLETIFDRLTEKETEKLPEESSAATEKESVTEAESEPASLTVDDIEFSMPVSGAVLVPASLTAPVYSITMEDYRTHSGVDIKASIGDSVVSCADGIVKKIWDDPMMGKSVSIDHGAGVESVYKNLADELATNIAVGAAVTAGQAIGCVGESALVECEEESHLHFELTVNGELVDPAKYIEMASINGVYED